MKIKEPWVDLGLVCYRCRRTPDEIPEYVHNPDNQDPHAFVWANEGTLDMTTGRFCCTECYIAVGMPSSPTGWRAP